MAMLMAFIPFIAFAVLAQHLGIFPALLAATLLSAVALLRSWRATRRLLALECAALAIFAALLAWSAVAHENVSLFAVRLAGDAGFMLVALGSMLIHCPFTLQYQPRPAGPLSPQALRVHNAITLGWTLAFAAMAAMDLAMLTDPALPARLALVVTVIALVAAIKFTKWYPGHVRRLLA